MIKRNQGFFISSDTKLSCRESLLIQTQWSIYQCAPDCTNASVEIFASLDTTFSELYIPAKTLPYGVYRLDLQVTMIVSPNMTAFASTFVSIVRSDLVFANLMPFGTSLITLGYEQDLVLAPGHDSLDLDQDKFIENVRSLLPSTLSLISIVDLGLGVRLLLSHLWSWRDIVCPRRIQHILFMSIEPSQWKNMVIQWNDSCNKVIVDCCCSFVSSQSNVPMDDSNEPSTSYHPSSSWLPAGARASD